MDYQAVLSPIWFQRNIVNPSFSSAVLAEMVSNNSFSSKKNKKKKKKKKKQHLKTKIHYYLCQLKIIILMMGCGKREYLRSMFYCFLHDLNHQIIN